jgi:cellulose synthase/poly-beta-1,6-N-acetylglucosamine synthase-like glycosyltransferase
LIPARNEDKNLEELLRTVVANDYPKLEIIVLDDNSNSQRISEIVKGFAHDGVRFVQGDGPKDDWLAKNQAYETLADNASGEYMVFMGVDVRLAVTSLRSLIEYSLSTKKDMVSVLPTRYDPAFWKGFFSPLRYFRELSKISPAVGGTPTLSTLWVIKKSAFDHVGGFGAATRTVIPERFFAKELSRTKQYAFIRSSSRLQVATAKAVSEQIDTSIRVSYPAQHRRLEANALSNIGMFVFMFLPFVQFIHAVIGKQYINALLSGIAAALLAVAHLAIVTTTNPILWPLAVINMPYLVLQEIALCALSMYRYEFGEVIWKGRGISQPVMQVIPHLPSIDSGDGRP